MFTISIRIEDCSNRQKCQRLFFVASSGMIFKLNINYLIGVTMNKFFKCILSLGFLSAVQASDQLDDLPLDLIRSPKATSLPAVVKPPVITVNDNPIEETYSAAINAVCDEVKGETQKLVRTNSSPELSKRYVSRKQKEDGNFYKAQSDGQANKKDFKADMPLRKTQSALPSYALTADLEAPKKPEKKSSAHNYMDVDLEGDAPSYGVLDLSDSFKASDKDIYDTHAKAVAAQKSNASKMRMGKKRSINPRTPNFYNGDQKRQAEAQAQAEQVVEQKETRGAKLRMKLKGRKKRG